MKLKSIILSCVICILVSRAMAQSTFFFQNFNNGIDAPVSDAQGNRLSGNYAVELWGGATSDSLSPTVDFDSRQRVLVSFYTGIGAGYFSSTASMTVFGTGPGGLSWVQVRAWDTRLGATWEEVAALGGGGYGESSLLYLVGGSPVGGAPSLPSPLYGLQSFSLRPIPEPSVWQLSLIGTSAIFLFRRKLFQRK